MEIVLPAGRRISLHHLEQQRLYAGVLCGRFTRSGNDRRLHEWVEEAGRRAKWFEGAALIRPAGRLVPARPADGIPEGESLPSVIAFSVWRSDEPARDPHEMFSSAAVAWCQDDFGLPDARTVDAIRALDWDSIAVDASP